MRLTELLRPTKSGNEMHVLSLAEILSLRNPEANDLSEPELSTRTMSLAIGGGGAGSASLLLELTPIPSFYIYDHLENTRVVYTPQIISSTQKEYTLEYLADYFPYGRVLRSFVNGERERYLTTGHERDMESGLDNRGARFYDGDVGRFLSVDPLAEKFAGWSGYNYVLGNPVRLIDPDGKRPESIHVDEEGNVIPE